MSKLNAGVCAAAILLAAVAAPAFAQEAAYPGLADRMHGHIAFLADDALVGRAGHGVLDRRSG